MKQLEISFLYASMFHCSLNGLHYFFFLLYVFVTLSSKHELIVFQKDVQCLLKPTIE